MTDPLSLGAALKALNESIGAVWKNGALLLWCLATVCAVVLAALFVAAHFNLGNAPDLFKAYSVYIGIAFLDSDRFCKLQNVCRTSKAYLFFHSKLPAEFRTLYRPRRRTDIHAACIEISGHEPHGF